MILTFKNYSKSAKIVLKIVFWLIVGCFVFYYSSLFDPFEGETDGFIYKNGYDLLPNLTFFEGYLSFYGMTGAAEPLSYFLFYLSAQILHISVFNSILNVCFLSAIFFILYKNKVNLLIALPLVLTNYYLILLEFSALRLKIGVLFWLVSILVQNKKTKNVFLLFSVLAHFQMLLIVAVEFAIAFLYKRNLSINWKFLFAFAVFGAYLSGAVINKILLYAADGFIFPYKVIVLFGFSILILNKIKFSVLTFLVFFIPALIIGEERINILYFLFFTYEYLVNTKRTTLQSSILCLLALYYSYKGFAFSVSLFEGTKFF